jgi:hypothetical protein
VVDFTGFSLLLDLRFGDPDEDARAVEAIALCSKGSASRSVGTRRRAW